MATRETRRIGQRTILYVGLSSEKWPSKRKQQTLPRGRVVVAYSRIAERDCMKSGLRVVIHYSSTYEKTLPDGSFRCRMELHTAPSARTQRARTAQDPRSSREILDAVFYVLKSGCQWRLLPHDFPRWPTVYHYFRKWRIDGS